MSNTTVTHATVTDTLTAAGIEKVSEALKMVYGALVIADTALTESDIIFAAGTKRTATGVALAELVAKGLVTRIDGHGTGKNRVPNTFALAVVEAKPAKKATKAAAAKPEGSATETAATTTDDGRYGKAMIRVWDFMKKHAGEELKVSEIVNGLEAEGEKTWYNATNQALRALCERPTGISKTDAKVNTYVYSDAK